MCRRNSHTYLFAVTFDLVEPAVGIGQDDSKAKFGIGDTFTKTGTVIEDDYGISVQHDKFTDIVSGVDPSKFAGGSGRIGDDVLRRGLGYGVDGAGGPGGAGRLISEDEGADDGAELDEQAMEALDLSEGKGIIRGRNGRPPMKVSTVPRKIEVLAEISFVPGLEGRAGRQSARQTVRALKPREVIVLGGTESSESPSEEDGVSLLAEAARSFLSFKARVLTPNDGDTAELSIGHPAYDARLTMVPYQTKIQRTNGDPPLDPIQLPEDIKLGECSISRVDCVATGKVALVDSSYELAPRPPEMGDKETNLYLSEGEVRLPDLVARLNASGMKAEYSTVAGHYQLLVNGKIFVRKQVGDESGELQVEGPLCEDFYAVRAIVAGQFVVL